MAAKKEVDALADEIGVDGADKSLTPGAGAVRSGAGGALGAFEQLQQISQLQLPRDREEVQKLVQRLQELQPGLAATSARFGSILLQRTASRLEDSLDAHDSRMSSNTVSFTEQVISALDSLDLALADFQEDVLKRRSDAKGHAEREAAEHVAASLGGVPSAVAKQGGALTWARDAQAELDRAPFFVKGAAKEGAEKYARQIGATEVTLEHVAASKGNR